MLPRRSSKERSRVDREPGDQPIDTGQEHEPLGAKRNTLAVKPEAWRAQSRLMESNSLKHALLA